VATACSSPCQPAVKKQSGVLTAGLNGPWLGAAPGPEIPFKPGQTNVQSRGAMLRACPSRASRLGSCRALSSCTKPPAILLGGHGAVSLALSACQSRSSIRQQPVAGSSGQLPGCPRARGRGWVDGWRGVSGRKRHWQRGGARGSILAPMAPWFAAPEPRLNRPDGWFATASRPCWPVVARGERLGLATPAVRPADCVQRLELGQRLLVPCLSRFAAFAARGQAFCEKPLTLGAADACLLAWWLARSLKSCGPLARSGGRLARYSRPGS